MVQLKGVMAVCAIVLTVGLSACGESDSRVSSRGQTGSSAPTVSGTSGSSPAATGSSTTPATTVASSGANRAPTISGAPAGSVAPGNTYIFQPVARDADNDLLSFTVVNLPSWARFDSFNGQIAGTPTASDVGEVAGVTISVSDGRSSSTLAPFTIRVGSGGGIVGSGTRAATISWMPPTEKTDGSAVGSLAAYKIHYGSASRAYTNVVTVSNPSLSRYVIQNLTPGTYYVAMTALTSDGLESDFSSETVARLN